MRTTLLVHFKQNWEFEAVKDGTRYMPVLHFQGESIALSDVSFATESAAKQAGRDMLRMLADHAQTEL